MPIEAELYDRLVAVLGSEVAAVYDTVRPDGLDLAGSLPIVVFQRIDSTPTTTLDGQIALNDIRFQVSIYCDDSGLTAARGVRASIIAGLHNFRSGSFKACWLVSDTELPPSAEIREYHLPIDFIVVTN
jgi:hypothetical protein